MTEMSTSALVASLKALTGEIRRSERRLEDDRIGADTAEALWRYVNDLHEALAELIEDYDYRQDHEPGLTPADQLLVDFARDEGD